MRVLRHLYVQVLIGIALGVLVGALWPAFGASLKPLGDAFIKLVKMMIAPIIFTTVVLGIAKIGDLKALGRVGLKALVYFEVVTTLALVIGLIVVNLVQPGVGHECRSRQARCHRGVANYAGRAKEQGVVAFLLGIIPDSFLGAFTGGRAAAGAAGRHPVRYRAGADRERSGAPAVRALDRAGEFFFAIIAMHDAAGAAGRVRGDGVHDRTIWRRHAGLSSAAAAG